MPSSFKVSAIINPVSRSSATASVHIGTDANNKMFVGQTGSDGIMNLLKRYNGSYVQNRFNSLSALNTDNYIECEYNNGVYTCKFNNETITDTTGNITPSKLCDAEQPVGELPHTVASQGDLCSDGHALTELEVGY